MKLHLLSDLHLEHHRFTPPDVDSDVVILAGDISGGVHGLGWAAKTFPGKPVLYVPGNHEFYGHDTTRLLPAMASEADRQGITLMHRKAVILGGVRFLGATLWTDFRVDGIGFQELSMHECKNQMADYTYITKDKLTLKPVHTLAFHETDRAWLERELALPFDGPTVVITHHCPHPNSIAERFRGSLLNGGFTSDLSPLLGFKGLWVHGHTHDPFDYMLGETRVICNPRGYPREVRPGGEASFNPALVVEV